MLLVPFYVFTELSEIKHLKEAFWPCDGEFLLNATTGGRCVTSAVYAATSSQTGEHLKEIRCLFKQMGWKSSVCIIIISRKIDVLFLPLWTAGWVLKLYFCGLAEQPDQVCRQLTHILNYFLSGLALRERIQTLWIDPHFCFFSCLLPTLPLKSEWPVFTLLPDFPVIRGFKEALFLKCDVRSTDSQAF